jgi:hypothetical protein
VGGRRKEGQPGYKLERELAGDRERNERGGGRRTYDRQLVSSPVLTNLEYCSTSKPKAKHEQKQISFKVKVKKGKTRGSTYLLDHCSDDTEERLVRGEETRSAGEGVALHQPLKGVLREHLGDSAAVVSRLGVPLEAKQKGE